MRHSLLLLAFLAVFLTGCSTPKEEAQRLCSELAWEGEKNDCYQQLAIDECYAEHCALIENETLQSSCERAVERACD